MKILITSVGSLVGQNILDALESRRSICTVIGVDASVESPRLYRCDRVYQVPRIEEFDHLSDTLLAIIEEETPTLVLPGRDHDVVLLSTLRERIPSLSSIIPCGSSSMASLMQDKWLSFLFAKKYSLPFASSFLYTNENELDDLRNFAHIHGFPLVAKPRHGFGSGGIRFIVNFDQLILLAARGPILVQECLEPFFEYDGLAEDLALGVPLFFQIPERTQIASQTIVGKDGSVSQVFSSFNRQLAGRCEYSEAISDDRLTKIGKDFASALFQEGWYGNVNIQLNKDREGNWKVFELNPRMTGSTSARLHLGYDEIGIIAKAFCPECTFPNLTTHLPPGVVRVVKSLTDYPVHISDMEELSLKGVWQRGERGKESTS